MKHKLPKSMVHKAGKFIALSTCIRKLEGSHINPLIAHLEDLEHQGETVLQKTRREEINFCLEQIVNKQSNQKQ